MLFTKIWGKKKLESHDKEVRNDAIDGFAEEVVKIICETVLIGTNNQALIKLCRQRIYETAEEHKKAANTVQHMGYQAVQASNHHVWISKNGQTVLHAQCDKLKTREELKEMIYNYIELTENGKLDITYKDESGESGGHS